VIFTASTAHINIYQCDYDLLDVYSPSIGLIVIVYPDRIRSDVTSPRSTVVVIDAC